MFTHADRTYANGISDLTSVSRIVRFSCPRHNACQQDNAQEGIVGLPRAKSRETGFRRPGNGRESQLAIIRRIRT